TVWLPTDNPAVLKVACPADRVMPPGVRSLLPSVKSTVPVGVPVAAPTVAVKVTAAPKDEGFTEEVTAVPVGDMTCKAHGSNPWRPSSAEKNSVPLMLVRWWG